MVACEVSQEVLDGGLARIQAFLDEMIGFQDIPALVEDMLAAVVAEPGSA